MELRSKATLWAIGRWIVALVASLALNALCYSLFRALVDRLCAINCVSTYVLTPATLAAAVLGLPFVAAAWLMWKRNWWVAITLWIGLAAQITGYVSYFQWFEVNHVL